MRPRELSTRLIEQQGQPVAVQGIARDVTERKALEAKLAHQAFHDALSGLPNRALFHDRLDHALAGHAETLLAVLFLDLDGFKVINDSRGHHVGDTLLTQVSQRLTAAVAASDTVARFGGDEFAVLLNGLRTPMDAVRVAERLLESLRAPFDLHDRAVHVTASLGVVVAHPGDADTPPQELLRRADVALYQAKAAGKDRVAVFDPAMHAAATERLTLEADLRRALERDELVLHYQPEVDLESGAIVGMEALLRWQHPERGLLSPDVFIGIAEETGLILAIDHWVLRRACRQQHVWQRCAADQALVMSVNLSARQFSEPKLVYLVAAVLRETGVAPASLRLEITETTAMHDAKLAAAQLRALKALGVQLAIDDFGTGYSSLDYLRHFPVDILKIDRSFVCEMTYDASTDTIVQAVVQFARLFNLDVVAEGIETSEQRTRLHALGCHTGQGFLFSPGISASAMGTLLHVGLPGKFARIDAPALRIVS